MEYAYTMEFPDITAVFMSCSINMWTTLLVFVITFMLIYKCTRRQQGVPPGPPLIPVFGNLLHLAPSDTFSALRELRQKYGDIYGLYIGSELTIFLNGYDVIHDALIKKGSTFAHRPCSNFQKLVVKDPSIICENGQRWKELRRFAMNAIREICFKDNGANIEQLINEEATQLVQKVNEFTDPFCIDRYINISVLNVMCKLLFSNRFPFEDDRLYECFKLISEGAKDFTKRQFIVNCFPFLYKVPGDLLNIEIVQKRHGRVLDFMRPYIKQQQDNVLAGNEPNSIVGLFIKRQMELEAPLEADMDVFEDRTVEGVCFDMFGAGSETTSSTLRWLIIHLIRNPRVQNKMFSEINEHLGLDESPSLADRKKLLYVEAVIMDVLRLENVAPLSVPHAVSHDISFRGFLIPQDSTIMVNLVSVLRDPNVFENPDEFIPERFLNADESELVISPEFIPFSLGPRSCLGESVARMELFLFVVALVRAYEFHPGAEGTLPDLRGRLGLTYAPDPFLMYVRKR